MLERREPRNEPRRQMSLRVDPHPPPGGHVFRWGLDLRGVAMGRRTKLLSTGKQS